MINCCSQCALPACVDGLADRTTHHAVYCLYYIKCVSLLYILKTQTANWRRCYVTAKLGPCISYSTINHMKHLPTTLAYLQAIISKARSFLKICTRVQLWTPRPPSTLGCFIHRTNKTSTLRRFSQYFVRLQEYIMTKLFFRGATRTMRMDRSSSPTLGPSLCHLTTLLKL